MDSLALWMPEPSFNSVDTLTARQVYSELQGLSDRTLVHLEILEPCSFVCFQCCFPAIVTPLWVLRSANVKISALRLLVSRLLP